jgi:hypothetical protein
MDGITRRYDHDARQDRNGREDVKGERLNDHQVSDRNERGAFS